MNDYTPEGIFYVVLLTLVAFGLVMMFRGIHKQQGGVWLVLQPSSRDREHDPRWQAAKADWMADAITYLNTQYTSNRCDALARGLFEQHCAHETDPGMWMTPAHANYQLTTLFTSQRRSPCDEAATLGENNAR
jgi:Membrane-bound toxin component of toxin-antitoxin system